MSTPDAGSHPRLCHIVTIIFGTGAIRRDVVEGSKVHAQEYAAELKHRPDVWWTTVGPSQVLTPTQMRVMAAHLEEGEKPAGRDYLVRFNHADMARIRKAIETIEDQRLLRLFDERVDEAIQGERYA